MVDGVKVGNAVHAAAYIRGMKQRTKVLVFILFVLSSATVLAGSLAKIQHWPIANVLLPVGMLAEFISVVALVALALFGTKRS